MKKTAILATAALLCIASTTAIAGGPDWDGNYILNSATITPIGTSDWLNSTAELTVGTTYTVDITAEYYDNSWYNYAYTTDTTLELSIGSTTWSATASAYDVIWDPNEVDNAWYDFNFTITADSSMLGQTYASLNLSGAGEHGSFDKDMGDYDINVSEPVPEPATMLLFGTGLVGIIGLSRRKNKA